MQVPPEVPALVRQIQSLASLPATRDAERAAIAVLRTLVRRLPATDASAALNGLLEGLALAQLDEVTALTPETAVMRELGVPAGRATDITRAVVVALIETLGEHAPSLFEELPAVLQPATLGVATVTDTHTPGLGTTIAEGRPGSRHPLARARPNRAQAASVATSDDPYAHSRLSSSTGLSAEREGQTLADARALGTRPLADATDAGRRGHRRRGA